MPLCRIIRDFTHGEDFPGTYSEENDVASLSFSTKSTEAVPDVSEVRVPGLFVGPRFTGTGNHRVEVDAEWAIRSVRVASPDLPEGSSVQIHVGALARALMADPPGHLYAHFSHRGQSDRSIVSTPIGGS